MPIALAIAVGSAGCQSPLFYPTPPEDLGADKSEWARVPIRDPGTALSVGTLGRLKAENVHYGAITAAIPPERTVDITPCYFLPPGCSSVKKHAGEAVGALVYMFAIPLVIIGAPIVIAQKLIEDGKTPKAPSAAEQYTEWMRGALFQGERTVVADRAYVASFRQSLGWPEDQSPKADKDGELPVSVGLTRVAILEREREAPVLLLCGQAKHRHDWRFSDIEACQTTALSRDEVPAMGDAARLQQLVLAGAQRLARLQAKVMTVPIPRGDSLQIKVAQP